MITEEQARLAANGICGNRYGESETDFLRWASDIQACATWITEELARRDAERIERAKPIDAEWLLAIGWKRQATGRGNRYYDFGLFHWFNGVISFCSCKLEAVTTRGQLLDLLAALKGGAS